VINVDTSEKLVAIVCYVISTMYVPISNRFHARRANVGNITTFRESLSFTSLFDRNPLT